MIIALALGYYYLGTLRTVALLAYLAALPSALRARGLSLQEIALLSVVFVSTLSLTVQSGSLLIGLLYARLYWGYLIFYFYFKAQSQIKLDRTLLLLALLTIVEFVLIRAIPGLWTVLPNYQETFAGQLEGWGVFGGVHSFGGNRTVSGVVLLAGFAYLDQLGSRYRWWVLGASVLCGSGTAIMLAIAYLMLRSGRRGNWVLLVALMVATNYALLNFEESFPRLSSVYLEFMYQYKLDQIAQARALLGDWFTLLFGVSDPGTVSAEVYGYGMFFGDFVLLDFAVRYGVLGVVVLTGFLWSRVCRDNWRMIVILVAGSLHYHVMFALPGQLFFGYFLSFGSHGSTEGRSIESIVPPEKPSGWNGPAVRDALSSRVLATGAAKR